MTSPVKNKINTIFVHVSDLHTSVKWYCQLLGQDYNPNQISDPVYNLEINHYTGLTLDAGPIGVTKESSSSAYPLFNFHTDNIISSYEYVKKLGYTIQTEITQFEDFSFFHILDPDKNVIMICTG